MNNRVRGILLLLIGFILIAAGIVAVYFLTRQSGILQNPTLSQTPEAPVVIQSKVVVVTHDMRLGDLLKAEDVSLVDMPSEVLPRDTIANLEDAIGKYIKTDLIQGEMLLTHNLADPTNVNGDLAYILSEDHVLFAIAFDDIMTRYSIPKRGDIIDLFITKTETVDMGSIRGVSGETSPVLDDETGEEVKVTRSFTFDSFQNLNITALVVDIIEQEQEETPADRVNQATDPTPPAPVKTITRAYLFAMDPQDALVLKYLRDSGANFDLVLRNPNSTQTFDLTPVTEEYIIELYGLEILK